MIQCADPIISLNKIYQNYNSGIQCRSTDELSCHGVIKYNKIYENKENGVLCIGSLSYVEIVHNFNITFNGKSGVKIGSKAHASIKCNLIGNNAMQGILITETSYAFIEKNTIGGNLKANVAFGGG